MMKQTGHAVLLLTLAIGAAFSYDQVRFGERTASFFRVAFADDDSGRAIRERRGFDRGERGNSERLRRVDKRREAGERSLRTSRPRVDTTQMRDTRRGRSRGSRGRGRHGHRGASISLEEVTYYTIIFVFATMLTGTIDGLPKKAARARKVAARE